MKFLLLLPCLIVLRTGYAQSVPTAMLPPLVLLGAYGSQPHHALQAGANQAVLGDIKGFSAAVYSERRFLLQELSVYHIAMAQRAGNGAMAIQCTYSGTADYNASKVGVAYGRILSERVRIGIQFDYWNQHLRGYGNATQVTVEGGLLVHVSKVVQAGFQVCNPAGVVLNKGDEKRPGVYTIGAGYQPAQHVALTVELIKIAKLPAAVQAGIEYRFTKKLWTKAGINSSTAAFFIAAGFQLSDFRIEVSGSVHPQLGLTPGMLLMYNAMEK